MSAACALAFRARPGQTLRTVRVAGPIDLGLAPPLALAGDGVKARHARLEPAADGWRIAPVEGTVLVNGLASPSPRPLRSGDLVSLGAATLTFLEEVEPAAAALCGNGFSRASAFLGRALDGLGSEETDLLRQLAELEEALENAPLVAATLRMNAEDFRGALEVLEGVRHELPRHHQLQLRYGLCLAKTEQLDDADRVFQQVASEARDEETRRQALDLRAQVASARQQKEHGPVLEEAMKAMQAERFFDAHAAFARLPAGLANEPPVKLMATLARVKLILSVPVQPGGRPAVRQFLSTALGDVDDVVARAQDANVRSQAAALRGQLQTLLRQL